MEREGRESYKELEWVNIEREKDRDGNRELKRQGGREREREIESKGDTDSQN